jgi:hypothetical protein
MSSFLDNELPESGASDIREHLALCEPCSRVCEELAMIIDFSHLDETADVIPPNPQALWCRINNIIEGEVHSEIVREQKEKADAETASAGSGWNPRRWNFSFMQIASAVLGIAIVSSVLTFVGIRHYSAPADDFSSISAEPTLFERALSKVGLAETPRDKRIRLMKDRATAIEYWNKRVEARRAEWNTNLRDAFDRNLNEINQAVDEYTKILDENPQDQLSGEMLDSVLNEKVDLLREFAEL